MESTSLGTAIVGIAGRRSVCCRPAARRAPGVIVARAAELVPAGSGGPAEYLLLVDGACGVCCLTGLWVERRVAGVRAIAIESSAGRRALAGMDPDLRRGSWHLCATGECRSGAAVVSALLLVAGHRKPALAASRIEPLTEHVYRLVVRSRGVWARVFPAARRDAARRAVARRDA